MEVLQAEDEWYQARLGDAVGYIPMTYVDPVSPVTLLFFLLTLLF